MALSRLLNWVPFAGNTPPFPAPAPRRPLWVIGDVHGCDTLLVRLLTQIAVRTPPAAADIVLIGDYIDRGDGSRAVLARLYELSQADPNLTCLLGNHEQMMFDFLDDPVAHGRRWLRHGGLQTLQSYGVSTGDVTHRGAALQDTAARLRAAIGPEILAWLRARPLQWRSGNVAVSHAALDPGAPPEAQKHSTLLWGHPKFFKTPRRDGLWVAHGHTIVDTPGSNGRGRIAVDTGAYHSGHLTAVLIVPDGTVTTVST